MDKFFSNDNINFIYGLARDKVMQQTNQDLDNSSKYYSNMKPLMKKIYNTVDSSNNGDLTYLNKKAVTKIIPFFKQLVEKKTKTNQARQGYGIPNQINTNYAPNTALNPRDVMNNPMSSNGQYDSNLEMTMMKKGENTSSILDRKQKERSGFDRQMNPPAPRGIPDFNIDYSQDNSKISNEYDRLMKHRDTELRPTEPNQDKPSKEEIEEFQNQLKAVNTIDNNFSLEPFNIDSGVGCHDLGQPLFNNIDELNGSDKDIAKLHESLQKDRQNEIEQYQLYQQQQQEMKQAEDETRGRTIHQQSQLTSMDDKGSYLEKRNRAGINTKQNSIGMKASELYSNVQLEDIKRVAREGDERRLQNVDNQEYFLNTLPQQNELFQKLLDGMRQGKGEYGERDYIETNHYVTVNGLDRLWENKSENRYNFVVHFNSSDFTNGAAITRGFKNVIAVELLNLIIPQDHNPLPFDHRLYVDLLSYPYLSLHIDEIDGVFNSTTNKNTRAFEHLIFDKEYFSELLTSEQIDNNHTTNAVKHKYSKQYKRGYYALKPINGGKKIYYHTPKASLNRLTIRLLTSDGNILSKVNDNLSIAEIAFEAGADKELIASDGFPRTTGQNIIKITTIDYFNNRTFKIGDRIKIKNYKVQSSSDPDDARFQEFITREEGHMIINLDEEQSGSTNNKGYINNLYISPPGEINPTTGELEINSYYTCVPTVIEYGNLINSSLQINLMFKITIREDKTRNILQPHNV
jgi:hypothetical protein